MEKLPIGLHFMNEGFDTTGDMLQLVPMTSIKFYMDLGYTQDPSKMALLEYADSVGCLIVGRRIEEQGFDENAPDMKAEAWRYYQGIGEAQSFDVLAQAFPMVDIWEGPNEPNCDTVQRMVNYTVFSAELGKLIFSRTGKKAGLGSWAVGLPDLSMWQYWTPVLEIVKLGYAVLTRHIYGPISGEEARYFSFRYREDQKEFDKAGYARMPLLITECGTDYLATASTCNKPWRKLWGYDDNAIYRYWGDYLKPLTEGLMTDSYVLGAHIFTCGTGGGDWGDFDIAHTNLADAILNNPPEGHMIPSDATHQVTATVLNIREYPWVGNTTPPIVGTLNKDDYVTTYDMVKFGSMTTEWDLIGSDGNRWVSGKYLKPIAVTPPEPPPAIVSLTHDDQGIDVSFYQGAIDWQSVKNAGIKFVFVKASESNFVDTHFTSHWNGSKAAGLLRGAYHYFRTDYDPVLQATILYRAAFEPELPLVLDVEKQYGNVIYKVGFSNRVHACLQELERLSGKRPMIYTGKYVWTELTGNPLWASDYPLWIAQYPYGDIVPTVDQMKNLTPNLPTGWTEYSYWQYTSKGVVNGIAGLVDLDIFNK